MIDYPALQPCADCSSHRPLSLCLPVHLGVQLLENKVEKMEGQGVSRAIKQVLQELKQEVAQAAAAANKVGGRFGPFVVPDAARDACRRRVSNAQPRQLLTT